MEQKTISQMVWDTINEIQKNKGNYDPSLLSQQIITLSSLYANLTETIANFEHEYQVALGRELDKNTDKPFNKVELETKRGEEYHRLKKAQALEKAVLQIIRASNKFIRIKENEQSVSKYS